jgi:hypothetical protein
MTAIISAHELWRRYGEGEVAVDALAGVTVEFSAGRFARPAARASRRGAQASRSDAEHRSPA